MNATGGDSKLRKSDLRKDVDWFHTSNNYDRQLSQIKQLFKSYFC